ncbi:hypothetical protein Gotur_003339 [Gossypium turneri]
MKEETPLKQIAAEAAKISKNKEIVLHKPKCSPGSNHNKIPSSKVDN